MRRTIGALRLTLALLLLSALAGCSSISMGYRNAPTLAGWWIDSHLDLPSAHHAAVERALDEVHVWHAGAPRAALVSLLRDVEQRFAGPVEADDVGEFVAGLEAHADRVSARFSQALLPQLPPLTPAELERVASRVAERQREYAEKHLDGTIEARRERRRERIEDSADDWFGSVSAVQREVIAQTIERGSFDDRLWIAERERRLRNLLAALGGDSQENAIEQRERLERWFNDWRRDRSPEVVAAFARQRAASIRLMVALVDAATPAQREHLRNRLRDWADDLDTAGRKVLRSAALDYACGVPGNPSCGGADGASGDLRGQRD